MKKKAIMFWSGGKDSALALQKIFYNDEYDVVSLVTTVGEETGRVSMHGVRKEVLLRQTECIVKPDGSKIPVEFMQLPSTSDNRAYEQEWEMVLKRFEAEVNTIIFGDIFLEDLKNYRELFLKKFGWKALFPLWKENTQDLVYDIEKVGIKSLICAIDPDKINAISLGKTLSADLVSSWSQQVDPCGEYGEYHTLTYNAPYFVNPLLITMGETVEKKYDIEGKEKRYLFLDLI